MPAWKLARRRFIVKLSSSPGCLLKQGQKMLKDQTGVRSKIVIVRMIFLGLILSY